MVEKSDEWTRQACYRALRREGLTPDQAAERLWRAHGRFGNPGDDVGDDRPLPYELKRRIIVFIEQAYGDPQLKTSDDKLTFNAFVRLMIREGRL